MPIKNHVPKAYAPKQHNHPRSRKRAEASLARRWRNPLFHARLRRAIAAPISRRLFDPALVSSIVSVIPMDQETQP